MNIPADERGIFMAEEKKPVTGSEAAEEGYRAAKLIRKGMRELERQYNTKKTKKQR